jgi:YD repeat-containing protein
MARWLFFLFILLGTHVSAAEIDAPTGALRLDFPDHEFLTAAGALKITRRYSGEPERGQFGRGWRLECASRLEVEGKDTARVLSPTGTQTLRRQEGDEYVGPHGQRLLCSGQTSTLKTPEGAFIRFDAGGREVLRQDAYGNQVSFAYDSRGRLTRVAAGARSEVRFSHGAGGRIESLEDRAGRKVEYAYDGQGRLSRLKGMDGWSTSYRYDGKGRLSGIQYPDGTSEAFAYDQSGRITEHRNAAGVLERYGYLGSTTRVSRDDGETWEQGHDPDGRPLWRQDSAGRRETWTWRENGQLLGRCYTDGSLINLAYDDQGRLISQESSTGNHVRFTYDDRGRLQSLDRNGAITRYQYDERGNVTTVTSPTGRSAGFEYDAQGRPTSVMDGTGRKTRLEFNAQGRLARQENPGGAVTHREFDDRGRLLRQVDRLGGVTAYHYQANGLLAKVTGPGAFEVRFEYDDRGRLVAESQSGRRTGYGYDPAGRLVRVRHGDGTEERFAYSPDGRLAEHTDRTGNVTRSRYGVDGRLQRLELPSGQTVRYERPSPGILRMSLGSAQIEARRKAGSRMIETRDASGGIQVQEMDANGRLLRHISPMGRATSLQYDQDGLPVGVVLPSGEEWRFHYDGSAQLDEVRFPDGSSFRLQYDQAMRLSDLNRSWGGTIVFRHDLLDRLVERTNGRGQVVRYAYDGAGRLLSRETPDGTWTYRYNERGDLIQVGNGRFTLRYSYDANGRLIKLQYPEWRQEITWQRDNLGRVIRRKGPDGLDVRYTYDKLGRLSAMEDSQGARFGFTYDDFGRLVKRIASNGTVAQYEYDDAGRVSAVTHSDANGKPFVARRYRYDADGNRVEVSDEEGRVFRLRYDPDGQLVAESTPGRRSEYMFGPAGNRKRMQSGSAAVDYRYDSRGRLVQAGDVTYEYDADGQLAARGDGSGTTRYRFDAEGNLIRAELPSGKTVSYGYGPFGERLWREEDGKRKHYLRDGDDVIAELSERFEPLQTFLYAGVDQPLALAAPRAPLRFIHQDDLESTLAITDKAGKQVGRYEFDSFGNVLMRKGDAQDLPPRYAGRPFDAAIGFYPGQGRPGSGPAQQDPEPRGRAVQPTWPPGRIGREQTEDPAGRNRGLGSTGLRRGRGR